ncbi:MAG TPA: hypothetical protein VK921_01700 [Anditalea sp.]|nr:hypothetical protein [Anditalea sp.]
METQLKAASYQEKKKYLIKGLVKGFLMFGIIILAFMLGNRFLDPESFEWLKPFFGKVTLIISIFIASEMLSGILPPELFIIWALQDGTFSHFMFKVFFLAMISYVSGFLSYTIGRTLRNNSTFRAIKFKFFKKYDQLFREYGGFLIIVATLSPLPFGAVALMGGAAAYNRHRYLKYSLWRFVRFFVYAIILWQLDLRYV